MEADKPAPAHEVGSHIAHLEAQHTADEAAIADLEAGAELDRAIIAHLEVDAALDRTTIANLDVALATCRRIGAAIGIIMATRKVTEEQAFHVLRIASQHQNRKLRDVADDVLRTGTVE